MEYHHFTLLLKNGYWDIFGIIIEKIMDKNPATSNNGWTPLHSAANNGHLDICRLIIENVDNNHPVDNQERTPKNLADQGHHFAVSQFFDS